MKGWWKMRTKNLRYCAFCKYWYDPTNSFIRPTAPLIKEWDFDTDAKALCMKRSIQKKAIAICGQYECKI
jgi:hypothetical protein